jgi:hypothetical protein
MTGCCGCVASGHAVATPPRNAIIQFSRCGRSLGESETRAKTRAGYPAPQTLCGALTPNADTGREHGIQEFQCAMMIFPPDPGLPNRAKSENQTKAILGFWRSLAASIHIFGSIFDYIFNGLAFWSRNDVERFVERFGTGPVRVFGFRDRGTRELNSRIRRGLVQLPNVVRPSKIAHRFFFPCRRDAGNILER